MRIKQSDETGMLHPLLVDIKLDKLENYRYLETSEIESACSEIEVAQLEEILRKYTSADDMFTGSYLHGTNQNIKIMVDMGKAVDARETVADVVDKLRAKEPLYFRLLVAVFKAWLKKTEQPLTQVKVKTDEFGQPLTASAILPELADVLITDLKDQLVVKVEE